MLLARDLITQHQHDTGRRYAWLRGVSLGNPLTRGERTYADPLDDETQADVEARWRGAAHLLRAARRKSIVDTVCVYERMPPCYRLSRLKDGLEVLERFFLTGRDGVE